MSTDAEKAYALIYKTFLEKRIVFYDAELQHIAAQHEYLSATGWLRACDSPGGWWYWTKEWKGRRWICFNEDQACEMQIDMGASS